MNEIIIEKASIENAEEILSLQKIAYVSEAKIIDDFTIPPLHQTLEEIQSEFRHQIFLKVELNDAIIGSVRTCLEGKTCYIGKLIVHPKNQNTGIGKKLLHAAEKQFPDAERYELFTGQKSKRNLYIYEKNGYQIFKNIKISEKLSMVFLEKINSIKQLH
ncbi:MAG: GNAT family N-acetyltransferase [Desulfobacula sp.]|uniref:GNAT family N-acetyltransferase n=1 Tax=Desulfobacula sp. TaxID=2593537 RepID=UPI001DCB8C64|nr:GNAT family N-acetyltransferase [Desulfobacula sp.]MBT4509209.1 GNAT family N-acetyltransferase [Desulfobacula sp.]MBT4876500.1 GNAT family N-acetyltransferase [Desulfobacula sp.]MBT6751646.1 GNAT family N-acetyltransferase [Desulfobacula sp.]